MSTPSVSPSPRDVSRDGLRNRLESWLLTHLRPLWALITRISWLRRWVNRRLIGNAVKKTRNRPHPFSSCSTYTSWESLTDRSWSGRHLPERTWDGLPDLDAVTELFRRPDGQARLSPKSTTLFPSFAQWFTDGFLRTDDNNRRKTTSNHEIDLCALYGLNRTQTLQLRQRSEKPGERGRLKSQLVGGEEFAPFLFEADGYAVKPEFSAIALPLRLTGEWPAAKRQTIFAFGGDRANATPQTAMLNTLFLREHNRLCGVIERAHPDWDDERVFQTARNVTIAILIKLVVEEYINHISPYHFRFAADPAAAWQAGWNRANWIAVEFNLLYRWHSLVPDAIEWSDGRIALADFGLNNEPLLRVGLARAFDCTSRQPAGELAMFNTAAALLPVEKVSIQQGRDNGLASYNDYREAMSYPRVTAFEQISGDPRVVESLRKLYRTPDDVEYFVGIFAEDTRLNATVPAMIGRMVGIDAFSQALTNPLLSQHVFHPATFSTVGWDAIQQTTSLAEVVARNVPVQAQPPLVTMTQPGWTHAAG